MTSWPGGAGLGRLPRRYVAAELAQGRLVIVPDGGSLPETVIQAVLPSRRPVAPKVTAFVDFRMGVVADLPS